MIKDKDKDKEETMVKDSEKYQNMVKNDYKDNESAEKSQMSFRLNRLSH